MVKLGLAFLEVWKDISHVIFISVNGADDSGFIESRPENVFNECDHSVFFACVYEDFPGIFAWINWCYSQPAELHFGNRHLLASSGVQQGDPLGLLLFLLVILQFIDTIKLRDFVQLNLWCLDDGT